MPPGPNPLQSAGARPHVESAGAPLFHNRFFTGLWTQRNILRDPSGVTQERWYGGRSDALIAGTNIELTNELTLARAPGSTAYSSATLPQAANSFYSFKQFTGSTESINVMVDTPAILYTIDPTSKTTVLTKGAGAGQCFLIGVNNVLYIGDGVDQKAWTGIGTARNWGIAPYSSSAPVSAYAGAASNVVSGGAGGAWTNPGNAVGAPDAAVATAASGGANHFTDYLKLSTYNISVTGTPTGITVNATIAAATIAGIVYAQLMVNGALVGTRKSVSKLGSTLGLVSFGGPADMWGTSLSAAQLSVNSVNFGIAIWSPSNGLFSGPTISVDAAQIVVSQIGPLAVSLVAGGVTPAPATGYKYVAAYGNSGKPVGPASPPTAVIRPDATHSVQIALTASTDPQVNQIWVFRTLDGGSVYENLPTSPYPNSAGNVTDSAADTLLNPFQLADLTGINSPPPSGFGTMEFHQGRIWGAAGNTVYYSVGSDLGNIVGSGYEGFPPANFFTFPSAVVRLLSLTTSVGSVLLVFTTSEIYPIYGNASAATVLAGATGLTPYYAGGALLKKTGLAAYNALEVRGSIIYMMTTDGRVISFNPTSQIIYTDPEKSINEIGFPIGNSISQSGSFPSLADFTPSNTYVTWHGAGSTDQALYVSDGSTGWFRCNTNQQPDGGMVWSVKRNIVGGCSAVQSIETSAGKYQLLIGPPSGGGSVLFRDLTVWSDAGSGYPATMEFGAIVLAHPGQTALPEFVTCDFTALGSQPILSVLFDGFADEVFTGLVKTDVDPPHSPPSGIDIFSNRYSFRQATSSTQKSNACRWLMLTINFGSTDTVKNELLTMTIFGGYEQQA